MTIQLMRPREAGKSKAALTAALNGPGDVTFYDPSIFNERRFSKHEMQAGEHFPVVMDPETRMRFATVTRKADGTWKVG